MSERFKHGTKGYLNFPVLEKGVISGDGEGTKKGVVGGVRAFIVGIFLKIKGFNPISAHPLSFFLNN